MLRIDAHLHVWRAAAGETPGVKTIVPPQTDVPIELAEETMRAHQIDRAVLVQPVFRGEDNSYVAACARAAAQRFAAVCVVDPRVAGAEERLRHWVDQGCRGLRLRPRIAEEAKVFGDPVTFPLWEAARRLGVVVSLLSGPEHAPAIGALAERFSDVSIVIDHLGHPNVAGGVAGTGFKTGLGEGDSPIFLPGHRKIGTVPDGFETSSSPQFRQLLGLARRPNVFLKVSGFYHFSNEPFPYRDCHEILRAVYDCFGPGRLLWGSDFPHVVPSCGYGRSLEVVEQLLDDLSAADRQRIFGLNALKLYWPEASIE